MRRLCLPRPRIEVLEDRCVPAVLQVGPSRTYHVPSQAAAVAQDGDDIQIDAGLYSGDVAIWRANNLTLEGVGGLAHLDAAGHYAEGKGIWVIKGNNTVVASIEFSGAVVPDRNGAGIRQEGDGLGVYGCYFHDNEDGILGGGSVDSWVDIEYTEFAHNGYGDGYSHNLYIGNVASLTMIADYTHDAVVGHDIKSRAQYNYIAYNRIQDSDTGSASYDIDLPNGGFNIILSNVIRKGPRAQNSTVVTSGEEGATNPVQAFYFINNTVVDDRPGGGNYVRVLGNQSEVRLVNNLFAGRAAGSATILSGTTGELTTNLVSANPGFVDPTAFDYHLTADSPAIDAATPPGFALDGTDLTPYSQFDDTYGLVDRPADGALDIGGFEYVPGQGPFVPGDGAFQQVGWVESSRPTNELPYIAGGSRRLDPPYGYGY
jgi:hypothetical protein